jgi:threonine/homoserine/homoserine lactone efflux protein
MLESIITISIVGLLTGFVCSMPIAGPISILITSNAFKGRFRYCNMVNLGASFATFTYVFIAVFGLTKLFPYYKPAIPYIFSAGSILLLFLGYKIFRTKIDLEHLEDKSHRSEIIKKREKSGFYTGFMINFFNPTLIVGWFTTTFFVISFVSSLGFSTGGLTIAREKNIKEISSIDGSINGNFNNSILEDPKVLPLKQFDTIKNQTGDSKKEDHTKFPSYFHLVISIFNAFFITLGSVMWFFLLILLIARFRQIMNIKIINIIIGNLGIILCFTGVYFCFLAVRIFFNLVY